jgi:MinD superfamily P-loop ATPase
MEISFIGIFKQASQLNAIAVVVESTCLRSGSCMGCGVCESCCLQDAIAFQ